MMEISDFDVCLSGSRRNENAKYHVDWHRVEYTIYKNTKYRSCTTSYYVFISRVYLCPMALDVVGKMMRTTYLFFAWLKY